LAIPRSTTAAFQGKYLARDIQAGIITGALLNKPSGGFQTASAPSATPADGSYAMIRFTPAATAADITKFLEANKLSLAGGPAPGGMYRVRLAATGTPKVEITRIVKQLQQNKTVEFIAAVE